MFSTTLNHCILQHYKMIVEHVRKICPYLINVMYKIVMYMYLPDRLAELQLSVLQHVADPSALTAPKLTENV